MGIRINAYGITENRYFVLVAGLWVTGCMLYLVFRREARNISMVIALAIIAVMTVVGPWSSFSVSRYSQNLRFEKILTKNGMLRDGMVTKPTENLTDADKAQITDLLYYFERNHDLKDVKYLPEDFAMHKMADVFGFEATFYYGREQHFNHYVVQDGAMVDISEYDFFLPPEPLEAKNGITFEGMQISYSPATGDLNVLRGEEVIYKNNVRDIAAKIHQEHRDKDQLTRDEISFTDENENVKVLYMMENFGGSTDTSTGDARVDWVRFYLFVKVK